MLACCRAITKLSCSQHDPVLKEICGSRLQQLNIKAGVAHKHIRHGVANDHIFDTAPCSPYTRRIGQARPRQCWHGVGVCLKLSCRQNGSVHEEVCGIHVNLLYIEAGVANKTCLRWPNMTWLRHCATFATHAPGDQGTTTVVLPA